jgi:tetratricopeptide (TPR) repeat protein
MENMVLKQTKSFFRKSDWISCLITFAVTLIVYVLTLQPTVGLEDSGELVVASDYLGVPHPPGYPIWSLCTWFFQWVFHSVTFHGHPNPAWAVNLFSAVAGAAACGTIALLISRSGMDLLRSLEKISRILGERTESLFCAAAGIAGGLLLAFGQAMWSQSVIAEVYSLNILFQSLMIVFLYRWMSSPADSKWLFLTAFTFGLGITNHQTLMFMGLAIAAAILFRDLRLFRDFFITGLFFIVLVGANKVAGESDWSWHKGPPHIGFWFWTAYVVIIPILSRFILPNGRVVAPTFLLMFLGLAFYFYMPFSSDQNPPINWGYPRTWQGFMHALTRGQYERVTLANVFTLRFLQQVGAYIMDLRAQFFGPVAALAAIPFLFMRKLGKRNNTWLATTFIGFFFVSIVFMVFHNPKTDIQSLFIGRTQYIQSHALFVIWIGYGLLLAMAYLENLVNNNPITKIGGVALVLLLPFSLVHKNYTSNRQLLVVGGCEQNGHDFGWQFGNWQLRGVEGIKEDLQYWHTPEEFEQVWAAYPNKAYPPPMGTNAIFFGGTDPGRFVPTYMIYSAKVRPDVYLITQNALADNTYMNVMRDLYGDQIWIPSPIDASFAFQQYVNDVRSGKIQAGADLTTENGRVQVQGVGGVMQINGYLSRMIFDHNQYRTETQTDEKTRPVGAAVVYENLAADPETGLPPTRTFYVEESYVLPWMYPYLTPHGLIMKINNQPTPLTAKIIKDDTDFWNWYCERLLNDERFTRDIVARKSFSKLRSSIAGLYAAKGRPKEAEAAFRQAVQLYSLSPEANFRLANLFAQQGRFEEATELFDTLLEKDPHNEKALEFREQLIRMNKLNTRRTELEQKTKSGTLSSAESLELITLYIATGNKQRADRLALHLLQTEGIPPQKVMEIAQLMARHQRLGVVEKALVKYTQIQPGDPGGWTQLAALQLVLNKRGEMWISMRKAIEIGGEPMRNIIRGDSRFNTIRNTAEYKALIPSKPPVGIPLSPLPGR